MSLAYRVLPRQSGWPSSVNFCKRSALCWSFAGVSVSASKYLKPLAVVALRKTSPEMPQSWVCIKHSDEAVASSLSVAFY